jgi:hypothetical protein
VSPAAVAATDRPSVSRKLNRPVPPAASTSAITAASATPAGAPARSLRSTSAHSSAESVSASRDVSSTGGSPAGLSPFPWGAGAVTDSGDRQACQSRRTPLWLNSQVSVPNGAAAAAPCAVPGVAERTAARTAPDRVTRAMSGSDGSFQMGMSRRYLAGTGSPSAYQPTPNPSAFTVPCRCRRGAHDCRYRPCGGSRSSSRRDLGGPR